MIVLGTHIWLWWVLDDPALPARARRLLDSATEPLGVSAICCWEVPMLASKGRRRFPIPVIQWFNQALAYLSMHILDLSPEISVEASQLPRSFHRDPADQIVVATARVFDAKLLTLDRKILSYPHVRLVTL